MDCVEKYHYKENCDHYSGVITVHPLWTSKWVSTQCNSMYKRDAVHIQHNGTQIGNNMSLNVAGKLFGK